MAKKHVDLLQKLPEYHSKLSIDQTTDLIFAALTTLGDRELRQADGSFSRGFMLIR